MNKILKLIGKLMKQGFATEADKAEVAKLFGKLKDADQEAVADQADAVSELPEEAPEGEESEEEEDTEDADEEAVEKGIKALFTKATETMKSEIREYMKEQGELMKAKAGVYHPDVQAKRKELNTYLRKLHSALIAGDSATIKEMTTDDQASPYAGYAVDSELSAEIRHLITTYGVARREMENVQLSQGSYKANNLVTDVVTYWVDEGSVINSTQAVLGQETLELKKLGAIVLLTSELIEDSEIDLMSFIASRVAEGFAQAEDEAFFKGDGTASFGGFTGLLEDANINEVVMSSGNTGFANLDADDLLDMQDATPQGAHANAKYYYHRTIKSVIRKLKGSDNHYIYQAPSEQGPATVWGQPEVLVEAMPAIGDTAVSTSFVLFGDLRKACIFGYKGAIKAKHFDTGSVRNVADSADINILTTDREAIRWTERIGYVVIIPSAVTKLTTAAS